MSTGKTEIRPKKTNANVFFKNLNDALAGFLTCGLKNSAEKQLNTEIPVEIKKRGLLLPGTSPLPLPGASPNKHICSKYRQYH
jgi:hypothetical protein